MAITGEHVITLANDGQSITFQEIQEWFNLNSDVIPAKAEVVFGFDNEITISWELE